MKTSSAKAKGRRLQDHVVAKLRDWAEFSHRCVTMGIRLEDDDILPAIMGESGVDVRLSPAARKVFPWSIECKNVQRLNIWGSLKQAEANVVPGTRPMLVFSRNRAKVYVVVELDDFLDAIT